jgi:hypothetical protein
MTNTAARDDGLRQLKTAIRSVRTAQAERDLP